MMLLFWPSQLPNLIIIIQRSDHNFQISTGGYSSEAFKPSGSLYRSSDHIYLEILTKVIEMFPTSIRWLYRTKQEDEDAECCRVYGEFSSEND